MARDSRYNALCLLDTERCILATSGLNYEQLLSDMCLKIDYVWEHSEELIQYIKGKELEITEKSLSNAELVKARFNL